MSNVFCIKCHVSYSYYNSPQHASRTSCRKHYKSDYEGKCTRCGQIASNTCCYHEWEYNPTYCFLNFFNIYKYNES